MLENTRRFGHEAYSHGRRIATQVDRGIGKAVRFYNTISPVLAPMMKDILGEARASSAHRALADSARAYNRVRSHAMEVDRMGHAIAAGLKKEGVNI